MIQKKQKKNLNLKMYMKQMYNKFNKKIKIMVFKKLMIK